MRPTLLALLLSLVACDRAQEVAPTAAPAPPERFAPSFVSLASPPDLRTMNFRITAPEDRALFLENCNGALSWGLEHELSGRWVPAWGAEINWCHSAPIEIAAGKRLDLRETVAVRPGESLPPGLFRLAVYGLYFTHDSRDHAGNVEVPHAFRLSAPFTAALQAIDATNPHPASAACGTSSPARMLELAPRGDTSEAKRLGVKGVTSIEVVVDVQGTGSYLAETRLMESSGSPNLDAAAMYAVRYSTFAPATCDGRPVSGKVIVKVALP